MVLGGAGGDEQHGGGDCGWGRAWPGHITAGGMFTGMGGTDRRGLLRSGCLVGDAQAAGDPMGPGFRKQR